MNRRAGLARNDRTAIAAICVASVAASIVLAGRGSDAYQVLGITHPVFATLGVVSLGYAGWQALVRRSWIPANTVSPGYRLALLAGLVLPLPVIVVDCFGGFGPDINVTGPDALLFYPSIALNAEFAFHVVPLAAAALLASLSGFGERRFQIAGYVTAAALEPVLQVLWGAEHSPPWANAYVGVHVLAFNVAGIYLLRRHGLLAVYLYRLAYYAVWHVAWGHIRLDLLFSS